MANWYPVPEALWILVGRKVTHLGMAAWPSWAETVLETRHFLG